jgi:hypothetical protein
VVAARETMFRERGWMTEMSVMEMPCGRARRMSPRASGRMAEPLAEVPAPAARPGRRRRGGSRAEAMPALYIYIYKDLCSPTFKPAQPHFELLNGP